MENVLGLAGSWKSATIFSMRRVLARLGLEGAR